MKIKPQILISIVVLLILIIAAVIFSGNKKTPSQQEEITIAKEIYGVSGTIEEIGENSLVINALILLEDYSKEPIRKKVDVLINDQTKMLSLQFPDPETLTQKQLEEGVKPEETEIKLADLKKGDNVDIQAKENISEKIKTNTSFTASVINVVK